MKTASNISMGFSYDSLPPTRSSSVNHEGLTPEQEWAKIADAAERRKIQNRNAQRKYRHNLKRRVEALERQHNLGTLFNSSTPSPTLELPTSSTPKAEPQLQASESPIDNNAGAGLSKEGSISPQMPNVDLMDPGLASMQNFGASLEPDWLSHTNFMSAPMQMQCSTLPSPPMTHLSHSPELCLKTHLDDDIDQSLLPASVISLSSLDSYIQHNNSIIEDMCSSVSSDDLDLSFHHTHLQRPGLPRRVTAPEPTLGRTTLHLAAMRGYLQIVHMLLEKGIDINTRDSQGWTALHLAAERGQEEVVKLLLDRGADLYATV